TAIRSRRTPMVLLLSVIARVHRVGCREERIRAPPTTGRLGDRAAVEAAAARVCHDRCRGAASFNAVIGRSPAVFRRNTTTWAPGGTASDSRTRFRIDGISRAGVVSSGGEGSMNATRLGLVVIASGLLVGSPAAHGAVLCADRSGTLSIRAACKPTETLVDPAAVCLQGTPSPPDSVKVANVCVDKWEASVWSIQSGNQALIDKVRTGRET